MDHFASLVELMLINNSHRWCVVSVTAGTTLIGQEKFCTHGMKILSSNQFPTRAGWEGISLQSSARFGEGNPPITVLIMLSAYL